MSSIIYPQYITWEVSLIEKTSALSCFSSEISKKIPKTLLRLKEAGYTFVFERVDASYMKNFSVVYKENITQKNNPKIFDVENEIAKKILDGSTIEALSLYKNDTYLGGSIYRVLDEKFSVIYRSFVKTFEFSLPVNIGIVADFFLYQKAIDEKKMHITHGRDRNLYGLHSDPGLVQFKLSVGGIPHVSKHENQMIFSREKEDISGKNIKIIEGNGPSILNQNFYSSKDCVFIFLGEQKDTKITKAILYTKNTDPEFLKKHNYLFKNPNFTTEVIEIKKIP